MNNFINSFRDNLLNRPQPELVEKDWANLEARLDSEQKARPLAMSGWWIVLSSALLLLGMNLVTYRELNRSQALIASLEARRDTVFHTKVIYITDTIYQTRVLRQTVTEYVPAIFNTPAEPIFVSATGSDAVNLTDMNLSGSRATGITNETNNPEYSGQNQSFAGLEGSDQAGNALEKEKFLTDQKTPPLPVIPSLPSFPLQLPKTAQPDFSVFPPGTSPRPQHKSFVQHINTLRPESFVLKINSGWAYPLQSSQYQKSGLLVGLEGEVVFVPQWRLWANASVFRQHFVSDRMDPAIGVPVVAPPNDAFVFRNASTQQQYRQFSAGLKFNLKTKSRWKPWIGAGYGVLFLRPHELVYDFDNEPLGVSWKKEIEIESVDAPLQFALLRGGVLLELSRKWEIEIGTSLRAIMVDGSFLAPRFTGLQLGLGYRF